MIVHIANRPHLLLISMLVVFFGSVSLFSYFEGYSFVDSLYWGVTTSSTVGYGDVSPKTNPGKLVACFLMISMVFFFVNLVGGVILGKIVDDKNVFTDEEQEELKQAIRFLVKEVDKMDGVVDAKDITLL